MSLRLTLRTLLAYLDDTLEPAKAREIGQKVSESDQAHELIERIRTVMRRRRLIANAADPDATDLDANDVAEYIDNVLDPEKLGALEQACIDSDMNLAEVASVHQILTLVLGKPAEVSDECRARMYALIGTKGGKPSQRTPVGPRSSKRRAKKQAALADSQAIPLPVPPYADGLPPAKKLGSIVTVIGLTIALFVVIWWMIQPTSVREPLTAKVDAKAPAANAMPPELVPAPAAAVEGERKDAMVAKPTEAADSVEDPAPVEAVTPPSESEGEPSAPAVTDSGTTETGPTATTAPESGPAAPVEGEQETDVASETPVPSVPSTTAETPAESEVPSEMPMDETVEPPPAPAPENDPANVVASRTPTGPAAEKTDDLPLTPDLEGLVPIATYASPDGLLLKYADGKLLRMKKDEDFVFEGDEIINPEGYRSLLVLPSKDVVELVDQTRWIARPAKGSGTSFSMPEGKFVYRPAGRSADLQLGVGDREYHMKIQGDKPLFGGEIRTSNPATIDKPDQKLTRELILYVIRGELEVADGIQRYQLAAGNELFLGAGDTKPLAEPTDLPPSWIVSSEATEAKSSAKLAERIPYKTRIEMTLREEAINAERSVRRLAILAMAATGDVDGLVSTLVQPNLSDAREVAIVGLRRMIGQDPSLLPALQGALVRAIGPANAPLATDLILGFSNKAQAEQKTYANLIDLLDSEQLVLRELAFFNLMDLTGSRTNYNYASDAPISRRRAAIANWRRWLESERSFPPRRGR